MLKRLNEIRKIEDTGKGYLFALINAYLRDA
jgi:hypothetical protein